MEVTSISLSAKEKEAMQVDAKALKLTVSGFIRGIYDAYRQAKHEHYENMAQPMPTQAISRRDDTIERLRQGQTFAEITQATGLSLSYIQKVAREFDLTPPNKDRLTIEKICEVIHALQTAPEEETYATMAKRLKVSLSSMNNLVPKAQAAGLMRKRKAGRPRKGQL